MKLNREFNTIYDLSEELLFEIFKFLDKRSFKKLCTVCLFLFKCCQTKFSEIYSILPSPDLNYQGACVQISINEAATDALELRNSNLLITSDTFLKVIDRNSKKILKVIKAHTRPIYSVLIFDENYIATASADCSVKIWKLPELSLTNTFSAHTDSVFCLMRQKKSLFSGSWDGKIIEQTPSTDTIDCTYKGHSDWVRALLNINDNLFASASNDGNIIIWQRRETGRYNTLIKGSSLYCLSKLASNHIISGSGKGEIDIWDIDKVNPILTKKVHTKTIYQILHIKDNLFLTASEDGTMKILQIEKNEINVQRVFNQKIALKKLLRLDNSNILTITKNNILLNFFQAREKHDQKLQNNINLCEGLSI